MKIPISRNGLTANVVAHKQAGYAIVNISLKPVGGVPGDATRSRCAPSPISRTAKSLDEIRVTHEQNLVLPHVRKADLHKALAVPEGA